MQRRIREGHERRDGPSDGRARHWCVRLWLAGGERGGALMTGLLLKEASPVRLVQTPENLDEKSRGPDLISQMLLL